MTLSNIIIGLVVLAALVYILRHVRGLFKGTASCCGGECSGSCSSCHPAEKKKDAERQDTTKS